MEAERSRRCFRSSGRCEACFGWGCKTAAIASVSHGSDDSSGKNSALHIFDVVCIESRLMTAHLPADRALLCMIDGRLQLKRKAEFDKGRAFYCAIQHCDISHRCVSWSLLSRRSSTRLFCGEVRSRGCPIYLLVSCFKMTLRIETVSQTSLFLLKMTVIYLLNYIRRVYKIGDI